MKNLFCLCILFCFTLRAPSQYEVHMALDKFFDNLPYMSSDDFEERLENLKDSACFTAHVDDVDSYIIGRSGNVITTLYRADWDDENIILTKVTLQGDTLEHIIFIPTGRVTYWRQGDHVITKKGFPKKMEPKEISKSLGMVSKE